MWDEFTFLYTNINGATMLGLKVNHVIRMGPTALAGTILNNTQACIKFFTIINGLNDKFSQHQVQEC